MDTTIKFSINFRREEAKRIRQCASEGIGHWKDVTVKTEQERGDFDFLVIEGRPGTIAQAFFNAGIHYGKEVQRQRSKKVTDGR